ncbi:MAG: cyclic nucleotide-binding domain-containing protein [Gammaproteobacteria bacterium]
MTAQAPAIDIERLKEFTPFDTLSDAHLRDLLPRLGAEHLGKGKVLFKRGQADSRCHFLLSGTVDLADAAFVVRPLAADDAENYLALDNYPEHRVSAITATDCLVVSIDRDHLDLVLTWSQAAESMGEDDEDEHQNTDWMEALLTSDLFASVPPANIQQLFARFQEKEAHLGDVVIKEGDAGDTFYVIKEGRALVTRGHGPNQKTLAALKSGDCFGEDALIGDAPRNATITMTTDGVLMSLDKESFLKLLKEPVIQSVTEAQYEKMMDEADEGIVLLDVRLPLEFRHDHLPHARNVPLPELRREIRDLEKAFTYVVTCDGGRRCEIGAYLLNEAGLRALTLKRTPPPAAKTSGTDHAG